MSTDNMNSQPRKKVDPRKAARKARNRKINQVLLAICLVLTVTTCGFMIYNVVNVSFKEDTTSEVLETDSNSLSNEYYTIGNNPTDLQREYFQELTDALEAGDNQATAEAVVKSFIADYFTWTNKDGNYDVGGSQYVYSSMALSFIEQSRYQFYADLDIYISEYGRDNLLEVDSVTITVSSEYYANEGARMPYNGYYIEATWTYKDCSLDTSLFQQTGFFYVLQPYVDLDDDDEYKSEKFEITNFAESWDTYTEDLNEAYDLE